MAKTCSHIRCKRKTSSCHECDIEVQSWYLLLSDCCIKYGSTFWWSIENCCDCTFFFSVFYLCFQFGLCLARVFLHLALIETASSSYPRPMYAMRCVGIMLACHHTYQQIWNTHTHTHKIKSIEACQSFALLYVHHFII